MALNKTEETNTQTLCRWYNDMWGQSNATLVPELVNAQYLRHDMTGANNLLKAEEYQAMVAMGSEGREVEDFTYFLAAEGDYVGALGRYIRDGNDHWDWVQLFRLENGRLSETWLPSMGGNETRAFAAGNNVWTGKELPVDSPNAHSPQKTVVRSMFEGLGAGQDITGYFADQVRWHDMQDADATLNPDSVQNRMLGWTHGDNASNLQLFLIEQDEIVFAGGRWLLGKEQRSWDWVCAFELNANKISTAWWNGINGSVVPVQQDAGVLWGDHVLPKGSIRLGSKVGSQPQT